MSPSIINKSSQSSYRFPKSHLSSKNSKIILLIISLFTSLHLTLIYSTLSCAAYSFLDHTFLYIYFTYFHALVPLLLKPNSKFLYKIFKNTPYPLRRSKMPLKSILSLRQQILPKDISNPFYV